MPFTTSYSNNILNWLFALKSTNLTPYDRVYLALSSNDPVADGGTFTELPDDNGYERVLICNRLESQPNLISEAKDRSVSNGTEIHFKQSTAAWTTARGVGLYGVSYNTTTQKEGTPVLMWYGSLADNPLVVDKAGMVPLISVGDLKITMADTDQPLT